MEKKCTYFDRAKILHYSCYLLVYSTMLDQLDYATAQTKLLHSTAIFYLQCSLYKRVD